MMRKIFSAVVAATLLMSCGGGKKENVTELENLPIQSKEVLEQTISDGHNARNSLDYQGVYKGVLPTASGENMEVTVEIKDSTYQRTILHIPGYKKSQEEGKYIWNETGTIITLENSTPANRYFVAENSLFALDLDGNRIEGDLAEQYKLNKE